MKTKSFFLLFTSSLLLILNSFSQKFELYMPSEISKAYKNGTRSYDGQPGSNYWQNTADYKIKVNIVPSEYLIVGSEEVVYYNSSPNEINTLVVRLYKDVYKKANPRAYAIDERDIDEGVELTKVSINNVPYDLNNWNSTQRDGTNIFFTLKESLKEGEKLTFKASWKLKIPRFSQIRTGAYDSTTFFIAYWYPQISVYDDIFGWDNLNYTFRTECYNNLANFDVEISTPDNFIVWATGTLVNSKEILPENIYKNYTKAQSSKETIHVISNNDLGNGIKISNSKWHYKASEVTDFAFGLSNHYLWDAGMQEIDNRKILISTAYPNDSTRDFSQLVRAQQKAIQFYSEEVPGISYPYEAFTTFIDYGGYGMEFPMIANNGQPDIPLIDHEIFHTYFPMYVRTNERRWAWMDEGWAMFTTTLMTNRLYKKDNNLNKNFSYEYGFTNMGTIADVPLIISSQFLTGENYDLNSYQKPAMVIAILHHYLGEELFLKCYREYINRWAKKSPTPYDFFHTFGNVSGQNLGWLWKPWFFEFGSVDIAIDTLKNDTLYIANKGNKPVPIYVQINYINGNSNQISKSADIWNDGKKKIEISIPNYKEVETILVNTTIADINYSDNVFPSLKSIYNDSNINDEIFGTYIADRYFFYLSIIRKDKLVYLNIPALGISRLIYPKEEDLFLSLDGSTSIKLNIDESLKLKSINLDLVGFVITCNKQN